MKGYTRQTLLLLFIVLFLYGLVFYVTVFALLGVCVCLSVFALLFQLIVIQYFGWGLVKHIPEGIFTLLNTNGVLKLKI